MATSSEDIRLQPSSEDTLLSRLYGAYWGYFLGDALGVPGHGYSTNRQLFKDYGWISDLVAPKFPHPESSLFRTRYEVLNEKNDILHGREEDWKRPGTHFHQHLNAGDNALEAQLGLMLIERIVEDGHYDEERCREAYLNTMLTPGRHRDTYIPTAYREFFTNYARGKALDKCAEQSTRTGAIALALPLVWLKWHNPIAAGKAMKSRFGLTHSGASLERTADLICSIHWALFDGYSLEETILERERRNHPHPYINYPFRRWIANQTDEDVAFHHLRNGSDTDDAIPLAFYLALKYQGDTEAALLANANLGGETCNRGALIGSLLGAANGAEDIPGELVQSLTAFEKLDALSESFVPLCLQH